MAAAEISRVVVYAVKHSHLYKTQLSIQFDRELFFFVKGMLGYLYRILILLFVFHFIQTGFNFSVFLGDLLFQPDKKIVYHEKNKQSQ